MPLDNETQTDRDVFQLREQSLSFRLLQLISYLASDMEIMLDSNMKTYGKNYRIRTNIADSIHIKIFAVIEENEDLKREIERLKKELMKYE